MTDKKTALPTPEEIAAARALVAEADAADRKAAEEKASAAAAERAERIGPLKTLVADEAFARILGAAVEQHEGFTSDPTIAPHLNAMIVGMTHLRAAVSA